MREIPQQMWKCGLAIRSTSASILIVQAAAFGSPMIFLWRDHSRHLERSSWRAHSQEHLHSMVLSLRIVMMQRTVNYSGILRQESSRAEQIRRAVAARGQMEEIFCIRQMERMSSWGGAAKLRTK